MAQRCLQKPHLEHLIFKIAEAPWMAKAPSTAYTYKAANKKRQKWLEEKSLSNDVESFILYLADQASEKSSSALAISSAAFELENGQMETDFKTFATDLIAARRREEVRARSSPRLLQAGDVAKIIETNLVLGDPKTERNTLLALLSYAALLRASEVAELKWSDVTKEAKMLKITIRSAKNDQLALGRDTFVDCQPGSTLELLLLRWRINNRSEFVFPNLHNWSKLSASAVSSIAKKLIQRSGLQGTHHDFRRAAANILLQNGLRREEIQNRGRWRSDQGMARYLRDSPEAQGFRKEEVQEEEVVDPHEEHSYAFKLAV